MKKATAIIIGIIIIVISIITIKNSPYDTTILLPAPNTEKNESPLKVLSDDLDFPTGIAILPDKRIVITEQTGKTLILNSNGSVLNNYKLKDNYFDEGAGLLGLAIHPQFVNNHYLYLYYTYKNNDNQTFNKVIRLQEKNNSLSEKKTIIDRYRLQNYIMVEY